MQQGGDTVLDGLQGHMDILHIHLDRVIAALGNPVNLNILVGRVGACCSQKDE